MSDQSQEILSNSPKPLTGIPLNYRIEIMAEPQAGTYSLSIETHDFSTGDRLQNEHTEHTDLEEMLEDLAMEIRFATRVFRLNDFPF